MNVLKNGFLVLMLGALCAENPALAQNFYKCKNGSGVTQYSYSPITGQKCSVMNVDGRISTARDPSKAPNIPASSLNSAADNAASSAASAAAAKAKTPAVPKVSADPLSDSECKQLAAVNATLTSGQRVYESDEKGERSYLSEQQKAERIAQYAEMSKTRCK